MLALATHGHRHRTLGLWQRRGPGVAHDAEASIRPDGWAAVPRAIQRIVVPLDGSPEAETAFQLAEPLAVRCGLPLVLLRREPSRPSRQNGRGRVHDLQAIIDGTIAESRRYLDEATASCARAP